MAKTTKKQIKKLAIVCSGGNAPGMSCCVNVFTKKCLAYGIEPIAFANGYDGIHNNKTIKLNPILTQQFIDDGSAVIGSSRCPQFATDKKYREKCAANLRKNKVDGLIVVGGEGSMKGALELSKLGVKVIVVPATIDNDVPCSSYTIGFDTCLNTVSDAISKIDDVFISHNGVAIIELMGRSCPDLTVRSAIAANATYAITKYSMLKFKDFMKVIKNAKAKGKFHVTFLVTEKLYPATGSNSLPEIAKAIEKATGFMCRHIPIGYQQRGGRPSARDRLLANYMVSLSVDALMEGRHSRAICRINRATVDIDLAKALKSKRVSWNKALVKTFNKINEQ